MCQNRHTGYLALIKDCRQVGNPASLEDLLWLVGVIAARSILNNRTITLFFKTILIFNLTFFYSCLYIVRQNFTVLYGIRNFLRYL